MCGGDQGIGGIGREGPGVKNTGESGAEEAPVNESENNNDHGESQGDSGRSDQIAERGNANRIEASSRFFGLSAGGFPEAVGSPRGWAAFFKFDGGGEKAFQSAFFLLNGDRRLTSIVFFEHPPSGFPSLPDREYDDREEEGQTSKGRQIDQPIEGHPDEKEGNSPTEEDQETIC